MCKPDDKAIAVPSSNGKPSWAIFPCHWIRNGKCSCGKACGSEGKHPLTTGGLLDATTDKDRLAKWWKANPEANLAVATGEQSGIVVVDVDPAKGGDESLSKLIRENDDFPATVETATGGGGKHFYFRYPTGLEITSRNGWRQGVDIKGRGGYVICPPSNHISGIKYRWADGRGPGEIEIASIPDWLLPLLPRKEDDPPKRNTFTIVEAGGDSLMSRARAYAAKADAASKGNRNIAAFKLAGNLAALDDDGGRLNEDEIIGVMASWNLRNSPPMTDDELRRCVVSSITNGQPRPAKESKARPSVSQSPAEPIATAPYLPFPVSILPAAVGNYVGAASSAIGCDASFVALPLLGCLARAIGNKRVIRLKRTWTEPAIIWGAIVGKSGTHKSPAIQAATSFLNREQAKAIEAFQEAVSRHEQEAAIYDRDYAVWKRSKSTEPPPWEPEEPFCNRFITTDTTIEALAVLLHNQFDGVTIVRDELAGWLNGIAEYKGGKGSDLGHWLAFWSAAPLTVDRKSGVKMLHVPRASVSIVGGIQPVVLQQAIGLEHLHDGLCARLLLAMPDPQPVLWSEAIVDPTTEAAISNVFDRLIEMPSGADGDGNPEPFAIPLSSSARALWIHYYNRHRAELVGLDDDLAAAWSKLEAYAARFALIFQLCSWASGEATDHEVSEASIKSGIALSEWFGGEAKRVYGLFCESLEDRRRRELTELIHRRGGRITSRELQGSTRQYRASGEAEAALNDLVRAGYGSWQVVQTSRRPRTDFVLSELSTLSTPTLFDETAETSNTVDADNADTVTPQGPEDK